MKIGLGIGVTQPQNMPMASVGSPSYLFRDGAQGTWYDPSDINLTWRRNLLTYSEQFDNAVWDKASTIISPNVVIAPDGTLTADKLTESATTAGHFIASPAVNLTSSRSVSGSIYVKAAERTWCVVRFGYQNYGRYVNLSTGAIGSVYSAPPDTFTVDSVGNGWFKITLSKAVTSGNIGLSVDVATSDGTNNYTGNGTNGIYIWGAQLELGSTATAYQRITDGIQDYLQYQAQPVLYRDAAGTTPVTGIEQPVGLMLDKSKGLVLGPELVVNGDFSSGVTGWAVGYGSISGGVYSYSGDNLSGGALLMSQSGLLLLGGRTYELTYQVISVSGAVSLRVANGAAEVAVTNPAFAAGSYRQIVTLSGAADQVALVARGGGASAVTTDNISVRELPGNHAFNSSGNSANFPVLSARYNLLTKSEDFGDAAWTKNNVAVTPNATSAPDGTLTADLVVPNTTGGVAHSIYQLIAVSGTVYSLSFSARGAGYTGLRVANTDTGAGARFDLTSGTVFSASAGVTAQITPDKNGFWRCTISFTAASGTSNYGAYIESTAGTTVYAGDGTSGIYIWGADLRVANEALNQPAYQRVNTSTDYDTVGFNPYLRFNGTNQWLQTNSIDFTYGDKMFVSAGVRKLSDAAQAIVVETSTSNGTFTLAAPRNAVPNYAWTSRGTLNVEATAPSSYSAPITNVVSGIGDISGSQSVIRVNSSQVANNSASQGTGNYSNLPLYIGARGGSSLWFNGRLYGMVVAGKQVSAVEIDKTEDYIALKTGFTYPSISGVPTFMVVL